MNILSFGEIVWDIHPTLQALGGAPLNFAAHVSKLGGTSAMLSAVGNDALGDEAIEQLKAWNVDTRWVARLDAPTGRCDVKFDENQMPYYRLYEDVAWDAIACDAETLPPMDGLYFGTLALRSAANQRMLETVLQHLAPKHVFADVNIRAPFYTDQTIAFAVEHATILKISDEEWPVVRDALGLKAGIETDAIPTVMAAQYPQLQVVLLTKGAEGAVAYERATDRVWSVDAVKASVKSTVGAGDSFSAAFFSRYAQTGDCEQALRLAARVAALVVSHTEAVPDYSLDDVM